MKKISYFVCMLTAVITILSGCQSPTGTPNKNVSDPKPSESAGEQQTLRLMIPNYFNEIDKMQWVQIVQRFEELHPEINIDLTTGDMQVENGKLTTILQSGVTPPDAMLINAGAGRIKILSDAKLIRSLNDAYKENGWQDKIKPFAYNLVSGSEQIYELPHSMDSMQVYYHKDLFEQNQIKVPTSKDEFIAAMEKLKAAGIMPISVGARDRFPISWMFSSMLEAVAGIEKVESLLYGDGKWNDPAVVSAIETLADWVAKGYVSKDSISLTAADAKFAFLNKKTAMGFYSSQIIVDAVENKVDSNLGTFTLPTYMEGQPSVPASGLGTTWVIPTSAEHADLAVTWMKYVLSDDFSKTVLSDPNYNFILVSNSAASMEPAGELLKGAMKAVENGSGYNPPVFIGPEAKEAYFQNLQAIVGGFTSAKEAADRIQVGKEKDVAAGYEITKK